jgi:hypothetical protein
LKISRSHFVSWVHNGIWVFCKHRKKHTEYFHNGFHSEFMESCFLSKQEKAKKKFQFQNIYRNLWEISNSCIFIWHFILLYFLFLLE